MYEVRYQKSGDRKWTVLPNVIGDGVVYDDRKGGTGQPLPVRYFILDDKSRIELPMNSVEIRFSPARMMETIEKAEAETGVDLSAAKKSSGKPAK